MFAGEPIVRVTAPLVEAQVVETWLLNRIASQTMLASKAARVSLACGDRSFVDFSARRDHGVDAAMAAARAAWICGATGTSLVAAGRRFGIPLSGTMAHSFVMSHDDERDAFRAYARSFPTAVVLLIDTYDTVEGARRAAEVAHELADEGITIAGVRLDSGDLADLSLRVRSVLDDAGLPEIAILASGDLDEHRIAALLAGGAPIDAFGVGTQLGTSADAPTLGAVYKLVEDADGPKMKLASGKVTRPGRKQVWRLADHDVVSLHDEDVPGGRPLLGPVMAGGRRTATEDLADVRARAGASLAWLPAPLRSLDPVGAEPPWPVIPSPGLEALAARVHADLDAERGDVSERIGLFGGTFDPPHVGHLVTAVNVRHELGLDRVLLVVNDLPWQKLGTRDITPAEDRFAMVEAAVGSVEGIEASRVEIDRGGLSFTADTLHDLQAEDTGRELFVVLGSDAAGGLPSWERAEEVQELATIVVVDRPGAAATTPPPGWSWRRVEVPRLEVSSTDLRARVADGRPLDYLLTPDVIAVVQRRGLYRSAVAP